MIKKNITRSLFFKNRILSIITILSFAIILIQFIQNRGMWGDEAALAMNIRDLSFLELLEPLDYGQVAPTLYLLLQKSMICVFGSSDIVLRILSFMSILIGVILLYKLIVLLEMEKRIALIGAVLFLLLPNIIYYSSEIKQYPAEVFAVILFLFCVLKIDKLRDKKESYFIWVIITLPLFYLSNSLVIVLPAMILYLSYRDYITSAKLSRVTLSIAGLWSLSFLSYYYFFITKNTNKSFMLNYWTGKGLPGPNDMESIFSIIYWSLKIVYRELFFELFAFGNILLTFFFIALAILGCIMLLKKRNYKLIIISIVPIITHLLLAIFLFYPFYKRLNLYMIPLCILLFCWFLQQIEPIKFNNFKIKKSVNLLVIGFFIFLLIYDGYQFPKDYDGYKKAITHLKKIKTKDKIFAISAKNRTEYYQDFSKELNSQIINIGKYARPFQVDMETLKTQDLSSDAWIIFSHKRALWKIHIMPILEERGTLEKVLGVNNFFNTNEDYYLYKFYAKKK